MATRNISLTQTLDQYIEERVRSGAFQNASEVVREGLRLLKKQEDEHQAKLERLRAAIQVGLDEIERGEYVDVEWDDLDDWLDGLGRSPPE
jgi:antitoxin ParD1/3/4